MLASAALGAVLRYNANVCAMTTNGAMDAAAQRNVSNNEALDEADDAPGRVSRIVEIVEREASPVTGAEEPKKNRDEEFEIETDLEENKAKAAANAREARAPQPDAQTANAASVEEIIEVTDAELEAVPVRSTQPSPADPGARLQRSRPPERPSVRPRGSAVPPAPGSLPPPRSSSPGFLSPFASVPPAASGSIPPGSVSTSSADPWLLANRTLELSRAQARIAELEEFIAFRDARIVALEEQLGEAQSKLRELEQKLGPRSRPASVVAEPAAAKLQASTAAKALGSTAAKPQESPAPKPLESAPAKPPAASAQGAVAKPAVARQPLAPDALKRAVVTKPEESSKAAADVAASAYGAPEKPNEVTVVRPVTGASGAPVPTVRSPEVARLPAAAPAAAASSLPAPVVVKTPAAVEAAAAAAQPSALADEDSAESEPYDSEAAAAEPMSEAAERSGAARGSSRGDDLRSIAGIGPRFEAALRKQGITRLSQIAAWSEDDVRQVAKALKIPKSRIVKGRWVESAREAIGTRAASE